VIEENELPEGWIWTRIGDIGWVTKLAGFEFTKYFKYRDSGPVRVVRGLNVGFGNFKAGDFKYIESSISDILPRSQLQGGELLIAYVGSLGTAAILPKDGQKYHLGPNVVGPH
jgi:type I restriction enzyme, S subunit